MRLDPNAVKLAIISAPTESDALVAVYRMVYPQWDAIEKIGDDQVSWPECNRDTWKRICAWFQELTAHLNQARAYDKQVMPGGVWMNTGFSAHHEKQVADWHVVPAPVTLKETA